jgi:beta-1,4-mannooligosaccharide/beta-1,4-mannosyl-N-acetylglucosamine phosphorylase
MNDGPDQGELIRRFAGNPILRPEDFPGSVNAVFNPAATFFDGKTLVLVRVEHRTGFSSLAVAVSEDGLTGWQIDPDRGLAPQPGNPDEQGGLEDPRITRIGDDYFVVYTGFSVNGPQVCLAKTRDFANWERLGMIMRPDDKDAALFPAKIGGRWALLHRPANSKGAHIWLSFSPDLKHWGDSRVLLRARTGGWWDNHKIGLGPEPLLTSEGWLLCYHGVRKTAAGAIYRVGLALLDAEDPAKVLARGDEWVLSPREPYERHGDVGDVVFPCGWIVRDDGDTVHIYYGAADSVIAVAETSLQGMLDHLRQYRS